MAAAERIDPVLERLAEDDYVYEQLAELTARLRESYARAKMRSAKQAARDQRLRHSLAEAAGAARELALAMQGKRRKPRRRRVAPLALLAIAAGGAAYYLTKQKQAQSDAAEPATGGVTEQSAAPRAEPEPVEAA